MNGRGQPTIYPPSAGELMDRANVLARDLMYDAPQRDGRAMLRAWGEVVEGASELWRRLPQRSDVPGNGKDVIDQLERSARTLRRSAGSATDVDPALQEIGQTFTQTAELIVRSGVAERREPSKWTDAQLQDAFAARVNIMHTLYVASHAISTGLAQNALEEKHDPRLRGSRFPADELRHQVLGIEQVAHSYINGHYPHALEGRHREPADHSRIPGAIATWDIYAQRILTREPTADAMTRVAGSAFAASTHAHRLWCSAAETGHVDRRAFTTEIGPALETMIEKWGEAHTLFQQLSHPHDASPRPLREAGWALIEAMREVTGDQLGPASADDISNRVDMTSLTRSLHRFHATVSGVGGVFHRAARDAPLLVDARAANNIIRSAPRDTGRDIPPPNHATVAPRDILHKRAIPLPDGIRGQAAEAGRQAALASRASLRSTLTASDGKPGAMTAPPGWALHLGSVNRLAASQKHQALATALSTASFIRTHPPR